MNQRLVDGGTIHVCPGRYQGNFVMGTGKLIGAGKGDNPATSTILDAGGNGRVVTIANNATAELRGLRITGGKLTGDGENAGGVHNGQSSLTIVGTEISANHAGGGAGGINNFMGTITLNAASRVINNTAPAQGAIFNISGTVHLNGATVTGNSAPQCQKVPGC